uniref:Uncharacterized protein n=1 Tax=Glossina pallidipes TaxID=7398 RepID=A0A1A9ZH94_GLOPL
MRSSSTASSSSIFQTAAAFTLLANDNLTVELVSYLGFSQVTVVLLAILLLTNPDSFNSCKILFSELTKLSECNMPSGFRRYSSLSKDTISFIIASYDFNNSSIIWYNIIAPSAGCTICKATKIISTSWPMKKPPNMLTFNKAIIAQTNEMIQTKHARKYGQ